MGSGNTPPGRERETRLLGKAWEVPPDAFTPVLRLPTPLGRGRVQQTELPCGLQGTSCLFKGCLEGIWGQPLSSRGWRVICRAPGGHPCPGGGSHSPRAQGRMASQGDLGLFPGSPRGAPRSTEPVCGLVSSQDELPSATCAPGPARRGPAGLPVPQWHLST